MSKRTEKPIEINRMEPKIGRTYKFWRDRSNEDFKQWLKLTGFLSKKYRIAHIVFGAMLLIIGTLELASDSLLNGLILTAFGVVILVLLLLGSRVKS